MTEDTKAAPLALAEEVKRLAEDWSKGKVATGRFFATIDRLAAAASPPQPVADEWQREQTIRDTARTFFDNAYAIGGLWEKSTATPEQIVMFANAILSDPSLAVQRSATPAVEAGQALTEKGEASADRNWIAGALWGYSRGVNGEQAALESAVNARQRDLREALAASPQASPTVETNSLGAPSGPGSSLQQPAAASAAIPGASLVGRRVQACDMSFAGSPGACEGATIMTEPQRGGGGDWQVLVLLDSRPDYLTPLGLNCLYLKDPS